MSLMSREFRLPVTPPFDWERLAGFLGARATPGVESVAGGVYRRTFDDGAGTGTLEVVCGSDLLVRTSPDANVTELSGRLERFFDLHAPTGEIARTLALDPLLAPLVERFPGIRVPGSWHPFETAVRAVVGQVVSVAVATTLAGRLAVRLGRPLDQPSDGLTHLFPTPERLAEADLSGLGLSGQKIGSIRALAQAVATGHLRFERLVHLDEALERLRELPGIGSWTAHYIAMRALGQRDAFPAGDLILRRAAAATGATLTERQLEAMSQRWRPYRAYAAMLLWSSYARSMRPRPERNSA